MAQETQSLRHPQRGKRQLICQEKFSMERTQISDNFGEGKKMFLSVRKIIDVLSARKLTEGSEETTVSSACGSDLISDVLSFIKSDSLLLTGLTTPQVIYAAEITGVKVICFVRGKMPDGKLIELAEEKGIILLTTKLPLYESCGRLYKEGLPGISEVKE